MDLTKAYLYYSAYRRTNKKDYIDKCIVLLKDGISTFIESKTRMNQEDILSEIILQVYTYLSNKSCTTTNVPGFCFYLQRMCSTTNQNKKQKYARISWVLSKIQERVPDFSARAFILKGYPRVVSGEVNVELRDFLCKLPQLLLQEARKYYETRFPNEATREVAMRITELLIDGCPIANCGQIFSFLGDDTKPDMLIKVCKIVLKDHLYNIRRSLFEDFKDKRVNVFMTEEIKKWTLD